MSELVVAQRYSRALLACIENDKDVDGVLSEIKDAYGIFKSSEELISVLSNPFVRGKEKIELMRGLAKKMKLSSTVTNFFLVLTKNDRILNLDTIMSEIQVQCCQRLKREDAHVYSAQDMEAGDRKELKKNLEKMLNLELNLQFDVDESLLGGFLVQTRNHIYDYSVKGQLSRLSDRVARIKV